MTNVKYEAGRDFHSTWDVVSRTINPSEAFYHGDGKMDWKERIAIDPDVLVGKPVVRGTRIAVEFIVDLLAEGWTNEEILQNYPQLTQEDIQAALRYAGELLSVEKIYPLPN